MNKRIAIPLEDGVLCPHFGHCTMFAIVDVENGKIKGLLEVTPPDHVPGLYPEWIAGFGVTDVIAGGMGQHAIELFKKQHINAFVGARVSAPVTLVKEFINGTLPLTANYCNHEGCQH